MEKPEESSGHDAIIISPQKAVTNFDCPSILPVYRGLVDDASASGHHFYVSLISRVPFASIDSLLEVFVAVPNSLVAGDLVRAPLYCRRTPEARARAEQHI